MNIKVERSSGNACDFNIFKSHHIRANVNVEPCEEWEGGCVCVCVCVVFARTCAHLGGMYWVDNTFDRIKG